MGICPGTTTADEGKSQKRESVPWSSHSRGINGSPRLAPILKPRSGGVFHFSVSSEFRWFRESRLTRKTSFMAPLWPLPFVDGAFCLVEASMRRCSYDPPLRCWYPTKDGLWASRAWEPGEREAYALAVLGRKL